MGACTKMMTGWTVGRGDTSIYNTAFGSLIFQLPVS